jgi:predicted ATPase
MRISRLILKNWRNFAEVDVALKERAFVVGPNASGKSNLLDAVRFLRDLVKPGGGLETAVEERGGVSKIRCLAARRHSRVLIGVEIGDDAENGAGTLLRWRYSLEFKQEGGGVRRLRPQVVEEKIERAENGGEWKNLISPLAVKNPKLAGYTNLEQPALGEQYIALRDFLAAIKYQHLVPQLLRRPDSFLRADKSEDYFGRDFMEKLGKANKNTRDAWLRRISRVLAVTVPNLKELKWERDEHGASHLAAAFNHWRGHDAKQREDQFSDGTLRMIGFLWSLLDGDKPILLEEPELSLHIAVARLLPEIIAKLQRHKSGRRQVILSTHSAEMLEHRGIGAEEIVMLIPRGESTRVVSGADDRAVKHLLESGLSPAEAALPKASPEIDLRQFALAF